MTLPAFSIITPVFRTPPEFLDACIASVEAQTFTDWELLLVDDGNNEALRSFLADRCRSDPRLRIVTSPTNVGIAAASQLGVDSARADFLALLDHDDTLSPIALERVAARLAAEPRIDYLYSDEDKLNERGDYYDPFFKPDWSPERFRHHMYTCHLSVLRTSVVRAVGGFRPGYDGSQDYDLVLRVTEQAREIAHIAEVLYHWRAHSGSTAGIAGQKPKAHDAGRRAVQDHCRRTGIDAEAVPGLDGSVRLKRRLSERPLVSLIIPTYGKGVELRGRRTTLITHLIEAIESRTTYEDFEYVVVGDRRMSDEVIAEIFQACQHPLTFVDYQQPETGFNFSEKVNIGATRARGSYLVLVNDDLEIITPDWIEEMLGLAQQPDAGAVGGMYYFEDDTIQHAGVITVLGAYHLFYKFPRGEQVLGHHLCVVRETSAVTGACLMVSRAKFVQVGGFTETLPNNFNDVDFCLKLRADGLRNLWTPHVEMYHFESQSRVNHVHEFEGDVLRRRWGTRLFRDPYYNPNLQAVAAEWSSAIDWDIVARDWPRPAHDLVADQISGYLEVNPDLAGEAAGDPSFDVLAHFEKFGRREGRIYTPSWPRPRFDGNARSRVVATPATFTVEGYLDANPDLYAMALRDPFWDPVAHFDEHGRAERRTTYVDRPEEAEPRGARTTTGSSSA